MDTQTEQHFQSWLDSSEHPDWRERTEELIRGLVEDYPDMLETHSWPEMRRLAEQREERRA